ncbi:MAG: 2-amino-4-hydroxy-6-hydroxymethyldihydropteridine diphosphokinase [Bacteroidia bacterium]|nr:2-amino-4-hydroxy-6-hydroxymethyldihydropteridine diphosphokinase [Bacteroidia bacterium]
MIPLQKIYLLLGGNTRNRFYYLKKTEALIEYHVGKIIQRSSVYETQPWGFESDNYFLNQAVLIETSLSPLQLLQNIHEIELLLGRRREHLPFEDRTIDIDILFYGDMIIHSPGLTIPHKQLHNRRFAITPLAEIDENLIHPVFNKTIGRLLEECDDPFEIIKITDLLFSVNQ